MGTRGARVDMMRIPGWRGMPTDSLSRRVEDVLRVLHREATRVVERRVAGGQNPVALALTAPLVAWRMLTTLSADERVMWLIWTWGIVLLVRGFAPISSATVRDGVTSARLSRPLLVVTVAAVVRLVFAALIPLLPDEAYYWEWSRRLAPGTSIIRTPLRC